MAARLQQFSTGQGYCFMCHLKMAREMPAVITRAGGEITEYDERSYGVVIHVRKI